MRPLPPRAGLLTLAVLAPLLVGAADVSRLRPPATHDGLFGVESTDTLYPMQLSIGGIASYAYNPVVWRYEDGSYDPVIAHQLKVDLTFAIGLVKNFDVGVILPVVFQSGPDENFVGLSAEPGVDSASGVFLGDLRLTPRFTISREQTRGLGLAIVSEFAFPTGDSERFVGDPGVAWRPRIIGSARIPKAPVRLTASLGYSLRKNDTVADFELADEFDLHAGAEVIVAKELGTSIKDLRIVGEVATGTSASSPFSGEGLSSLEILGGVRARVFGSFIATLGAGPGLTQGLGTPDVRAFVGLAYAPLPPDSDNDGIPDNADACPDVPEDQDRFDDDDGCPEPDNDGDGILDKDDRCPDVAEDMNGIKDEDGCPDEGVFDEDDDTIQDADDKCPNDPEDFDEFEDDDGCPEPDNDKDGIKDADDKCPEDKETINGIDDWDGCPDEGEGDTEYIENVKIEIKATIHFETSKATIKEESKNLLDQVALQILAHPEVTKVRVEGHTDSVGPAEDNLYLSQDRADSVRRYLIGRGIAKERLEAIGYGEERPIDNNGTAAGRTRNRRVDFVILQD